MEKGVKIKNMWKKELVIRNSGFYFLKLSIMNSEDGDERR
jgi:hypothetical protein